jgi:phosphoribosylamine--glycine ligase
MRLLLIGTGAREGALAAALAATGKPKDVFALGTDSGIGAHTQVIDARPDPIAVAVAAFKHHIDLVVIDPATPGADRIAGALAATGTTSIGAGTFATRAASSRTWTLDFLADNRIPTADHQTFDDPAAAAAHAIGADYPLTVADDQPGTPARYCRNPSQAAAAIDATAHAGRGRRLLLRRCGAAEVVAAFFTDGSSWQLMPHCRDLWHSHRRVSRDLVPAAATPAPAVTPGLERIITKAVIAPFCAALTANRLGHRGAVTARIALDPTGPKVVDLHPGLLDAYAPLTLPLLESDLAELLAAAAAGRLADVDVSWSRQHAVTLTASAPMPHRNPIEDTTDHWSREVPGTWVFDSGTGSGAGEQNLTVVGTGSTFKNARIRAYARAAWLRHDSRGAGRLVPGGAA